MSAASISGTVIENVSGRPLARTKVILQARTSTGAAGGGRWVLTGSGGEFQFSELSGGIYFLRAERRGYATTKHGQTDYYEPGTPIVLGADGYFATELRLKRLGVISGSVFDENQVGLERVTVHAYRKEKSWISVASTRTDDRGVYRLSGLKPGEYLVRTASKQLEDGIGLLPTYYGQAVSAGEARIAVVKLDGEAGRMDITPMPGRLGKLSGRLLGASASQVQLLASVGRVLERVKPGGRFDFGRVEPGQYTLLVDPRDTGGKLAALEELTVGESDVEIEVAIKTAPKLTIECGTASGAPLDQETVSIFLRRKNAQEQAVRVQCGMSSVWGPGDWEIGVQPPTKYYTVAILEGSRGESEHELRLLPGLEQHVTVVLSDKPGRISGIVQLDGNPVVGAPVLLNAYDAELRSRAGGVLSTRADTEGRFRFAGLPPGRYELVSSYQVRDVDGEGWEMGIGTAITVEEEKEVKQNLPLTEIR